MEQDAGRPLSSIFDLIAATSTGALVGLPLAAGLAASTTSERFKSLVPEVFRPPGTLASFRRRAMYDPASLRRALEDLLGAKGLDQLLTDVLVPVAVADRYEAKILNRRSSGTIVEAILASSAAPTYFPPHNFVGPDRRAYIDGGLWANDPTHLAVAYALHSKGLAPEDVDILVVGNGSHIAGAHTSDLERMRRISVSAFRILTEGAMTLQRSHSHQLATSMGVTPLIVEPTLAAPIRLDDAASASKVLLPLVDDEYDKYGRQIRSTFLVERHEEPRLRPLTQATEIGVRSANLTTFIPNRQFYKVARGPDDNISAYISSARRDLTMVSINLMTGDPFEQLLSTFHNMIDGRNDPVNIRLSLLDPENEYVMGAIAPVLDMSGAALSSSIRELVQKALYFRSRLSKSGRRNFTLHAHEAIPPASAIMIDTSTGKGRIQLETKTYRTSPYHSFGFEVSQPSEFYDTLCSSYEQLIEDGRQIAGGFDP